MVNNPLANAGDAGDSGSIPGSGRSPEEGNGNPLEYSCLENSMDRGAWWAIQSVALQRVRNTLTCIMECGFFSFLKNLRYS